MSTELDWPAKKKKFVQKSMTLDPRPSTLDPRPSTWDPRPSTLDKKIDSPSTLDTRPLTHDPRHLTLDPPPSTKTYTLWLDNFDCHQEKMRWENTSPCPMIIFFSIYFKLRVTLSKLFIVQAPITQASGCAFSLNKKLKIMRAIKEKKK